MAQVSSDLPESSSRSASGRYLLRAPLSVERLELEGAVARYRHKRTKRPAEELFDPQDLLARLLMHIPVPRLHVVRYYGHYATAARARRHRAALPESDEETTLSLPPLEEAVEDDFSSSHRRRLRRQWARMTRRVYESDPLLCVCAETMRVISFLTDPRAVTKILRHLDAAASAPGSARAPPESVDRQQLAS
jgi:hypothetical protein